MVLSLFISRMKHETSQREEGIEQIGIQPSRYGSVVIGMAEGSDQPSQHRRGTEAELAEINKEGKDEKPCQERNEQHCCTIVISTGEIPAETDEFGQQTWAVGILHPVRVAFQGIDLSLPHPSFIHIPGHLQPVVGIHGRHRRHLVHHIILAVFHPIPNNRPASGKRKCRKRPRH